MQGSFFCKKINPRFYESELYDKIFFMRTKNILQKDYTINQKFYQLKLPLNIDYMIPANDSVRLLSQFVEEMDLKNLYSTYSRVRENQVLPRKMLKIMIYGYMNKLYSSRDIENACRRDINFMFLLEDSTAPDHVTFARFRSLHFAQCGEKILADMSNFLYDIKVSYKNTVQMKHVKKLRKKLYSLKKSEGVEFVHGCGKRKTALQRSIETLEEYLSKFKEYTKKVYTCGSRNSYSKTDVDATFMRMKEDAMKNGQLKPAYNLQHGVDSEYIVWLTIGPQPTDTTTLIPFLKIMEERLNFKYLKIIADAGYESEKTIYACEDCNNCGYKSSCIKRNNSKTPLEQRTKRLETSKNFNRQRKEDLERIISEEGCILRINRSIQVEGSFAQAKQDMGFRRFMCRGQNNVLAESILLAMALNINKLHSKIQAGRTGKHLFKLKKTA